MKEKTRLLIVEDERIVAMDLKQRLQQFGYEVVAIVANSVDAIQAAEEHNPDMILMDIRIQGDRDGIDTARITREKFGIPHIFLTAHRDDDTIERAKQTEPYGYLLKPFNDREIQATIEMALYANEARKQLRQSEVKFRTLIQNSSDVITVVDFSGNIEFASPSVKTVLGYEPESVLSKNLSEFIHPEDWNRVEQVLRGLIRARDPMRAQVPQKVDIRFRHAGKGWVYLESIGSVIMLDGARPSLVINSRDITDRKRVEMELIQAKVKAEEMNRLKTTFLSNISHEIRTPLTGIIGFSSILESEVEDESHLMMVKNISKSGERLLETVEAVLDLALLESSKVEVNVEDVELLQEIEQSVRMLAALAIDKRIRIKIVEKNDPGLVKTDSRILLQILNHVIGNAIKFTEKGSVTITLDRLSESVNGSDARRQWAVIEVRDTGVGIDEEFIPYIFDEFKQESEGNNRKFEGAGIGLSIVKRLLAIIGGEVKVESKPGKGSTFTLLFSI